MFLSVGPSYNLDICNIFLRYLLHIPFRSSVQTKWYDMFARPSQGSPLTHEICQEPPVDSHNRVAMAIVANSKLYLGTRIHNCLEFGHADKMILVIAVFCHVQKCPPQMLHGRN